MKRPRSGASLEKAVQIEAVCQIARVTFPERRHLVQTVIRRGLPSTIALTFWRFGYQRRLVLSSEWLTLFPDAGDLPQTAHILGMRIPPCSA